MAIIAALIGGGFGFMGFVTAWFGLGYGFLPALGVYIAVGTSCSLVLLVSSTLSRPARTDAGPGHGPRRTSPELALWQQDALFDRAEAEAERNRSKLRSADNRAA